MSEATKSEGGDMADDQEQASLEQVQKKLKRDPAVDEETGTEGEEKGTLKETLDSITKKAKSSDPKEQLEGVQSARKFFTKNVTLPIDILIESGIVPVLIQCLSSESVQYGATWALANIAAGVSEQTLKVLELGAVPPLIKLLESPHANVRELAVLALGNISSNNHHCRDIVISNGIIPPLLKLVQQNTEVEFLCTVLWALSNLSRSKEMPPSNEAIGLILPTIMSLLQHENVDVKVEACWALCHLVEGEDRDEHFVYTDYEFQELGTYVVLKSGDVITPIVHFLDCEHNALHDALLLPALRTLGHIMLYDDVHLQMVVKAGILPHLLMSTDSSNLEIIRESLWIVSTMCNGIQHHLTMLVESKIFPVVIAHLTHRNYNIRKEATIICRRFSDRGDKDQVSDFVHENGITCRSYVPEIPDIYCYDADLRTIPIMIRLLGPPITYLSEQVMWAFGSMASCDSLNREYVIEHGGFDCMLQYVRDKNTELRMFRLATWAMSNVCRHSRPLPPYETILLIVPELIRLLTEHEDLQIRIYACWGLAYLSQEDKYIDLIVDAGMIPKLIEYLSHENRGLLHAVLRIMGNLVTGTDEQIETCLELGILERMRVLMHHPRPRIVREAMWTVGNLSVGSLDQIQYVLDSGIMPFVFKGLYSEDSRMRREASGIVSNLTEGTIRHMSFLAHEGLLAAMCNPLDYEDDTVLKMLLQAIHNMLRKTGSEFEFFSNEVRKAGGVAKFERLQHAEHEDISKLARTILRWHFPNDLVQEQKS